MTVTIEWDGVEHKVEFAVAVSMMDEGVREYVHHKEAPCTEQHFVDRYCDEYYSQFGSEFRVW